VQFLQLTISDENNIHFMDISLTIGSGANFAGDGHPNNTNTKIQNGFRVCKIALRYYVSEKNHCILGLKFPNNSIKIGDEVISLNDKYCEHIRNVRKYIETIDIRTITLRSTTTQYIYTERMRDQLTAEEPIELNTSIPSQSLRTTSQRKRILEEGMYLESPIKNFSVANIEFYM